jgi:DUF1680 family protein
VAGARPQASAVLPTESAISVLRPLDGRDVSVTAGFWAERLRVNRERTIGHGWQQLQEAGNLTNLRLADSGREGAYRSLGVMFDGPFPFLDSDVYKWLEAVGWELGVAPDAELARASDEAIDVVASAQRDDGYLNSFVQVLAKGREYQDLAWGHELYTFGHLIQAAIAWHRALSDDRLLRVAIRAADSIDRELGAHGREGIDGHPGIEMALVELYRTTGEARYLELAARQLDLRGRGLLGAGRNGAMYWQDHAPVREAATVAGHAVRQLYLDCGAVDVACELGDRGLIDAVRERWRDMLSSRMYLTGGLGSRHRDEAFGDPFELPPDRAYAETCAGIASVMLAWRLLLATGDPACADLIERTMLNAVLPGISLDGSGFFYVNTLQRRTGAPVEPGRGRRAPWFACACCPPNIMRVLSSWPQQLATHDESGIQLQQYATGDIGTALGGGPIRLAVETGYPWQGRVSVAVLDAPGSEWTLSMRIPGWAGSASVDGRSVDGPAVRETRAWQPGDRFEIELPMPPRVVEPDPRVDAVRGCVALERGPLVYCIEGADLPPGTELEALEVDAGKEPGAVARPDVARDVVGLALSAVPRGSPSSAVEIAAVPYFTWANRSVGPMRVWIPRHSR